MNDETEDESLPVPVSKKIRKSTLPHVDSEEVIQEKERANENDTPKNIPFEGEKRVTEVVGGDGKSKLDRFAFPKRT